MVSDISSEVRGDLSRFVTARLGLSFPPERARDLDRGIAATARELGFKSTASFVETILSSPRRDQMEVLASNLTVGETFFFRHPTTFRALEREILPDLILLRRESRRLRIWSAGCATGEEPYSAAILLKRIMPDLKRWNITILATDINSRFLKKASKGVYGEWSFRDAPPWLKGGYFRKTDEGRFELLPEIRSMVSFCHHNLAEDSYPSMANNTNAMDIILCRNILMYFTTEAESRAIQALRCSLVDGGALIVSPCELSTIHFSDFCAATLSGATVYFRRDQPEQLSGSVGRSRAPNETGGRVEAVKTSPQVQKRFAGERRKSPRSSKAPSALRAEARRLYNAGRYREAESRIASLLPLALNDQEMMDLLARVYANQGNLSLACEWSAKAIAADKMNSRSHYLHAAILEEQGRIGEAAESLKRALYLEPDFVLAHFSLGNLHRRQGKVGASRKHFRNALSLLRDYAPETVLAASEGLTAGRLAEIIVSTSGKDGRHGG